MKLLLLLLLLLYMAWGWGRHVRGCVQGLCLRALCVRSAGGTLPGGAPQEGAAAVPVMAVARGRTAPKQRVQRWCLTRTLSFPLNNPTCRRVLFSSFLRRPYDHQRPEPPNGPLSTWKLAANSTLVAVLVSPHTAVVRALYRVMELTLTQA